MMRFRSGPKTFEQEAVPLTPTLVEIKEEVDETLNVWVDENYRGLIDKTEFLDSSRVKRID